LTTFHRNATFHTNQIFIVVRRGDIMYGKDSWHEFKCFGSAIVGSRGQVVIPAHARKELDIEVGATLLVFSGPGGRGLFLFKADAVEQLLKMVSEQLPTVEKLLTSQTQPKAGSRSSGGRSR
jgi:bifunctional DNA-binding transcriptional regulator/antitoxin component of YhaV-PrlF toxin-antitoxin module